IVRDAEGNEIGSSIVDEAGDFVVELEPPQTDGGVLDVVLQDEAGNESEPANVTAPVVDSEAPEAPPEVAVADDGTAVTGRGEPGTTAIVRDADGNELGQAVVDELSSEERRVGTELTNR